MLTDYTAALRRLHHAFARALAAGRLDLVELDDLLEPLAPLPAPAVDLATIATALDYLPGEPWRHGQILLQAGAPGSPVAEAAGRTAHGLQALDLGDGQLLLNLRRRGLAFPACYWLALLCQQLRRLLARAAELGLDERLGRLLSGAQTADGAALEQTLAEVAFCAGTDLARLAALDAPRAGRLSACLVACACGAWSPRLIFHQELAAVAPADEPGGWAAALEARLAELDPEGTRPLHLVLADTPAIGDVLSPYARELREVLASWAHSHPQLVQGGAVVRDAIAAGPVGENLLYWVLPDFLVARAGLRDEQRAADETVGIWHHGPPAAPGSWCLIDLARVDWGLVDPRLLVGGSRARPPGAAGLLVVLALQDLELAAARLGALLAPPPASRVLSINVLRRALALRPGPQLFLPTAWLDQLSGACLYPPASAPRDLSAQDFYGLIEGAVTAAGPCLAVPSSIGQHPADLDALAGRHGVLCADWRGADLINAVLTAGLPHGAVPGGWTWRAVYYACERLLEADDLRQGLSESSTLAPAYAGAIAVLRAILREPNGPGGEEPPRRKGGRGKPGAPAGRLRLRA